MVFLVLWYICLWVYFSLLFPILIFSFYFQVHIHRMHRLHKFIWSRANTRIFSLGLFLCVVFFWCCFSAYTIKYILIEIAFDPRYGCWCLSYVYVFFKLLYYFHSPLFSYFSQFHLNDYYVVHINVFVHFFFVYVQCFSCFQFKPCMAFVYCTLWKIFKLIHSNRSCKSGTTLIDARTLSTTTTITALQ